MYRPYGVAFLVAAYDSRDDKAYLHMVNTSGESYRYQGVALGKSKATANTELEKLDLSSMTVEQGLKEVSRILHTTHDDVKDKDMEIEASWISQATNWKHEMVPKSKIEEANVWAKQKIAELDDDSEEEDDSDMEVA